MNNFATDAHSSAMPERLRALLFLNGLLLFVFGVFVGWQWFFALIGRIELWPLIPAIDVRLPDDSRAWRMVHLESITQGLLLLALGLGGIFLRLSLRQHSVLFWSALITAWLFTVPTWFHALFGTRGLAFGGTPFKGGLANDVLYLVGWPPVIAVHILLFLAVLGVWRHVRSQPDH
jgi:hypothetical protein